jgi:DNA-binding CsgD family transcriptional regulator
MQSPEPSDEEKRSSPQTNAIPQPLQSILSERGLAESIVTLLREPIMILDDHFRVVTVNNRFADTFRVQAENVRGRMIYEIGEHQWDIAELQILLEGILPQSSSVEDYEVAAEFPGLGFKHFVLNGRRAYSGTMSTNLILITFEDVTEKRLLEQLKLSNEQLARQAVELAANTDSSASAYVERSIPGHMLPSSESELQGNVGNRFRPECPKMLESVEERLIEVESELEETARQLSVEREELARKNVVLSELLDQISEEKREIQHQFVTNIQQAILPTVLRLMETALPSQKSNFELLLGDLQQIVSPFVEAVKDRYTSLSPREVEICRLIKNGMNSKQIAETLNISPMTVQKYREMIRKKLGITNADVNLSEFLQSIV